MHKHSLGIDVGTQGLKAVVVDPLGCVLWSHTVSYPTSHLESGYSEQNPQDWIAAVDEVFSLLQDSVYTAEIEVVGITGQMHTMVISDDQGNPLRPAILWSDTRSSYYGNELVQKFGKHFLLEQVGNIPLANFTLLRLLWVKDNEPEIFNRISHVSVAKDWVRYRLTGKWNAEPTDASGTYLFDVSKRQWNLKFMQALDISDTWWSKVVNSTSIIGDIQYGPESLRGIPVIAGCGDQSASAIGSGLETGRDLGISLGTSGVVFWPTKDFLFPPHDSVHSFCHAIEETWHWMGVTQSAAASLTWFKKILGARYSYEELENLAKNVPPGCEGLIFLPYLQGERTPIMDSDIRGMFLGISASHTTGHLFRAILEGVTFSLKHAYDTMNSENFINPRRIIVTGGGAQSKLWLQIIAEVFNHQVIGIEDPGAAVGVAVLAGKASNNGLCPNSTQIFVEISSSVDAYEDFYIRYKEEVVRFTT